MAEKSNLVIFAENELARIVKDEDGMQDMMNKHILQMVQVFSEEGHSGFSANYAIGILNRLLRYLPLTELTGADDEWSDILDSSDQSRQNKRCSLCCIQKGRRHCLQYQGQGIFRRQRENMVYQCKKFC